MFNSNMYGPDITSQLTSSVPSDRRTFMSNINQHTEFCLKSSSNRKTQIFNAHHHQQQQSLNEKGKTKNPNKNQDQKMRMEEPSNEKRKNQERKKM
jgi:hypothetical protein